MSEVLLEITKFKKPHKVVFSIKFAQLQVNGSVKLRSRMCAASAE
jgi:hypothetical protein